MAILEVRNIRKTFESTQVLKDISFLLCGCQALEKKQQSGAAVEVHGHYLYRATLDSLTLGLSSEDSLRVTQQYISQWAKDILLYDNAKAQANSEIERMVSAPVHHHGGDIPGKPLIPIGDDHE